MSTTIQIILALLVLLMLLGAFSAVRNMSAEVDHGPDKPKEKSATSPDEVAADGG